MPNQEEQYKELLELGIISEEELVRISVNAELQGATAGAQVAKDQSQTTQGKGEERSRKTAALLAILLGGFLAQKAYLKQISSGVIVALIAIIALGFLLGIMIPGSMMYSGALYTAGGLAMGSFMWFIGNLILSIVAIYFIAAAVLGMVEGATYLTMSEERFKELYVEGNRKWF